MRRRGWLLSNSRAAVIATLGLAAIVDSSSAQTVTNTFIPDSFRGKIVYDGYMEGQATLPDGNSGMHVNLGGYRVTMPGSRTIPLRASYHLEVEYTQGNVTGSYSVRSDTPGVSQAGVWRGTRAGDQCNIVDTDGLRMTTYCGMDQYDNRLDYVNAKGQHIVAHYNATKTTLIDYDERDRLAAAASARSYSAPSPSRLPGATSAPSEEVLTRADLLTRQARVECAMHLNHLSEKYAEKAVDKEDAQDQFMQQKTSSYSSAKIAEMNKQTRQKVSSCQASAS